MYWPILGLLLYYCLCFVFATSLIDSVMNGRWLRAIGIAVLLLIPVGWSVWYSESRRAELNPSSPIFTSMDATP